jgi:hypothetical protein
MDEKSLMWVEIQAQTVELGCQICQLTNTYQKGKKVYQTTTKYTKGE